MTSHFSDKDSLSESNNKPALSQKLPFYSELSAFSTMQCSRQKPKEDHLLRRPKVLCVVCQFSCYRNGNTKLLTIYKSILTMMSTSINWFLFNVWLRIQFILSSSRVCSGHSYRHIMMVNCHRLKVYTSSTQTHWTFVSIINKGSFCPEIKGAL